MGQRVRKPQPEGFARGEGMSPSRRMRLLVSRRGSGIGTEESSARV